MLVFIDFIRFYHNKNKDLFSLLSFILTACYLILIVVSLLEILFKGYDKIAVVLQYAFISGGVVVPALVIFALIKHVLVNIRAFNRRTGKTK